VTTPRIAVNPLPYWSRDGKSKEVFAQAFADFAAIGYTAVKADVPEETSPADYLHMLGSYGLTPDGVRLCPGAPAGRLADRRAPFRTERSPTRTEPLPPLTSQTKRGSIPHAASNRAMSSSLGRPVNL
jgi:hypothetical protein